MPDHAKQEREMDRTMAPPADPALRRLENIVLPDATSLPSAYAEADRRQAVADLLTENLFDPVGVPGGPFALNLCVREGRLVFDIRDGMDVPVRLVALALGPFRRLIKDYHLIVDSHEQAVAEGGHEARIQAIDMGRRGLHNDGSQTLRDRLGGKIDIDFDTARRLFTLVCVLHWRG
jgi:uncharacterized protein (UPF0262 family)